MIQPQLYSKLTDEERRDARFFSRMDKPTIWHMRQVIRYFIADTNGIYIRVMPKSHETGLLIEAFNKAKEHFTH